MNDRQSKIRDHLLNDYSIPIRDPLWGHIYLSPGLKKLVETAEFQQLARIKQLGPSYLVYPGATHTRLNHSLGVFHTAYRMILGFIRRGGDMPFSLEGVKAFLVSALLHDLGHFPYTHSLKELPVREHEELTAALILDTSLRGIIKNDVGTRPETCAAIVDESIESREPEVRFFRKLLSGPIDPDKLDYLNRDAYFCGVPYGSQDVDYILSVLHPDPDHGVVIEAGGTAAIESLLFSKYLMYRAVYWHNTVRIATGMIKKSLHRALEQKVIAAQDLYGLDDDSFYTRIGSRGEDCFDLIRRVYNRELHKTLLSVAFDEHNPIHLALQDLDQRAIREDLIRAELSDMAGIRLHENQMLLDIPERISFEANLMVRDGDNVRTYGAMKSVFTPEVVHQFVGNLRQIRLAVAPEIHGIILERFSDGIRLSSLGGL
jgi:HD superfamily phosphohydrolase